ncbi:MAG TPA: GNAT family N-acetyltransferase [Pyrinomonadaceae bacterium]|nr:GNAT family N-acetyltransferase [Pyrinomonadaceae bacterium]
MEIVNAIPADLDTVMGLYDYAAVFQRKVFGKGWLGFDKEKVAAEITERRLWKITEAAEIACIFIVTYSDPILWGEHSHESAIYIHRIVTGPEFHGRGYVRNITAWSIEHARENSLRFIRMDTWSDNRKLVDYYQNIGFKLVGNVVSEESPTIPRHYWSTSLALFEIDLNDDSQTVQFQTVDR